MKGLSKLAKFFIICAIVFVCGIVCSIAGAASGGVQDIDKLADRYDWIHVSPGERGVTTYPMGEFHSIEATGDADLCIVGKDFYKKASWLADQDLLEQTELDVIGPGKVCVVAGDRTPQPEIEVKNGVLTINSGEADLSGINLNMTEMSSFPEILVCVPEDMLQSLTVSGQTGDVEILGVTFKAAEIGLNTGDISVEGVKSESLTASVDTGDIEIQGKLMGTTSVTSETGDIEIDTSLAKAEYALEVSTATGDLELVEDGKTVAEFEESEEITQEGGPHKITVSSDTGDVKLTFENAN